MYIELLPFPIGYFTTCIKEESLIPGQVKPNNIKLACSASLLSRQHL